MFILGETSAAAPGPSPPWWPLAQLTGSCSLLLWSPWDVGLGVGVAGSPTLIPRLGLCTALDHLLPRWVCSDFSLRLLFHPPFPPPIRILTQPTYYTEFFQKALSFQRPSGLLPAWGGGAGLSGDLGGGPGPGSNAGSIDALAATLWQVLRTAGLGPRS